MVANIFLLLFLIFDIIIYMAINKDIEKRLQPVPTERVVELGMTVMFYPKSIQQVYSRFMDDDQLTVSEEDEILSLMLKHDQAMSSGVGEKENNNANKTDLELAKENLAAFDRLADDLFDTEQKNEIRRLLVEKVNNLSKTKD